MASPTDTSLIAVTGASGEVGKRLAAALERAGADLRMVVRDPARAPRIEGAEVRVASGYAGGDEMTVAVTTATRMTSAAPRRSRWRRRGSFSKISGDVARLTGRKPSSLEAYLAANPDALAGVAGG